jgi:hypothetical protein
MIGSGGLTVGGVVTTEGRDPMLSVSIDYWLPDGEYQLAAQNRTGDSATIGTLDVADGRGAWTGSASAVEHPVAVTLTDASGAVVCRGRLG